MMMMMDTLKITVAKSYIPNNENDAFSVPFPLLGSVDRVQDFSLVAIMRQKRLSYFCKNGCGGVRDEDGMKGGWPIGNNTNHSPASRRHNTINVAETHVVRIA